MNPILKKPQSQPTTLTTIGEDLSDTRMLIEVHLQNFGITLTSSLIIPLLRGNHLPTDGTLSRFTDEQLYLLLEILEDKWRALSTIQQGKRIIVNALLKQVGRSWEDPVILEWLKAQKTPFTALRLDQLKDLEGKLKLLLQK